LLGSREALTIVTVMPLMPNRLCGMEVAGKLEVVGAGGGGVEELSRYLNDAEVLWGLLRFELGSGAFARSKVLLLHFNGEDCLAVKRARANSLINDVKSALRDSQASDNFHACIELRRVTEVTTENVLSRVSEFFIIDHVAQFSPAWITKEYYAQLATEHRAAEERERARAEQRAEEALGRRFGGEDPFGHSPPHKKPKARAAEREAKQLGGRRYHCRGLDSFKSGRDALRSVADGGVWNWVLVGPDAEDLPLVGGGSGSVDEMRDCAKEHEDIVMFGLLRLVFGVGRLKRTKYAFVHLIGPQVSAVKRGRINAVRPSVEAAFKEFANSTVAFYDLGADDLSLEGVIERVRHVSVVDDAVLTGDMGTQSSFFSVEAFRQAMAQEHTREDAAAERTEAEASISELDSSRDSERGSRKTVTAESESAAVRGPVEHPPNADLEVSDTLRLVRQEQTCNWALFRLRLAESRAPPTLLSSPVGKVASAGAHVAGSTSRPGSIRERALRFDSLA